jgi:hypothetical protein
LSDLLQPTAVFLSSSLILAAAIGLTAVCLWIGSRMTPWFLKETITAPSVRTLLLSDDETEVSFRVRIAACGLSMAVMLGALLAIVLVARSTGWSPNV